MGYERSRFPTIAALGMLIAPPALRADIWDNSAGNSQWSTATNWADNTEPTINDPVIFNSPIPGGLANITLISGEFASTLTFNDNYTLLVGNINLGADTITVASGRTATMTTAIVGSGGLTKSGAGRLNLYPTSSNSFTGPVVISGFSSTVAVRTNLALGNPANSLDLNGGRLILDGSVNPTFLMSRVITIGALGGTIELQNNAFLDLNDPLGANANPLTVTGVGTAEFNSTSSRTGSTFVTGPIVRLNNPRGLGTPGSANLSGSSRFELANSITYTGFLTLEDGTGLRAGSGTSTFDGVCFVNGLNSVLLNGGPNAADSLILGTTNSDVFRFGAPTTLATVSGPGTTRVNNANSYVGNWHVISGTLDVRHADALGTGTTPVLATFGANVRLETPTFARPITINAGARLSLASNVTTSGNILLNTGGALLNGGFAQLALNNATLTINNAGVADTGNGFLALDPGTTGAAQISGQAQWDIVNSFSIGHAGSGTLSLQAGAQASSAIGHIGSLAGSSGTATVSGLGSNWNNSGFLGVGYGGQGTLHVQSGGSVSSDSSFVAADPGSIGVVNVDGVGSLWNVSGSPVIGEHGNGELNVTGGAHVTGSAAQIGRMPNGDGLATVSGAGSDWSSTGTLIVAGSGTGELRVESGGHVFSGDYCQIAASSGSQGAVTVVGPNSVLDCDDLYVGFQGIGSLDVLAGGVVNNAAASIAGGMSASTSNATVSGVGSVWNSTGELSVGDSGTASLTVEDGGQVLSGNALVGRLIGGNGTVTVSDAGSLLDANGSLIVGYLSGTGNLSILDGAHVNSDQASVGNSSGTGFAAVSGAGSQWAVQGSLGLGFNGAGTLTIGDGASVSALQISLGFGSGSTGEFTLDGDGATASSGVFGVEMAASGASSTLNLLAGTMTLDGNISDGGAGVSTLTLDGATLDMLNHTIGGVSPIDNLSFRAGTLRNVGQINNGAGLTKTGTGTLILNTANTYNGTTAVTAGTLRVSNGTGSATGGGAVAISSGATLGGTGRITGPVTNGGAIAPGASVGTLTLLNSYQQTAAGSLNIEMGPPNGGLPYDRLSVSNAASLAGTLNVTLIGGFTPAIGQTFDVLTAAPVSGTFATVNLPPLAGGADWQIDYLTGAVRLTVVDGGGVPGDVDGDGHVTLADLSQCLAAFGTCTGDPQFNPGADFNDSGCIDLSDLSVLLANFGI